MIVGTVSRPVVNTPVEQQRLLHVLLGVLALMALVGLLFLVDGVIAEIVRTLP